MLDKHDTVVRDFSLAFEERSASMTPNNPQFRPLLLSDKQVAELLGCHRNTIWNRVRKDQLPAPIKWEGKTVWRRRDIEEFVDMLYA